jgi:hypothetical protein
MNTRKMLNKPKLPFVLQTDLQTIDENTTAERARALSQQIEALYDAYYANSTLEGEHSWYDMHQRDHDALIELEEVVRASSKPPLDVGLVAGFRNKDWRNDYLAPMQMVSVQDHRRNEIFTGIIAGKVQGNNVQVILLRDGGGIAPSWVLKSNITPVKEEDLARLSKFYATTIAKIRKQIAPAESDKKPEYQISNNEKESANAQNDGNQRMWFCLAADGQLVILGDHSDFDAAEDAATSSGVEAIWIFDRITADSWVSTLTSPEAKMSLRDDCYPSAAEIIDVEYLIDSELIEHSERIWRNAAGKLHRKDGPAVESANGNKEWWVNGKLHREGLPAIERANGDKEWYQNGLRYREDGPSIDCVSGYRAWYRNGQLHREDGPAIEHANGDKAWCRNGVRHREDGPAIEYADGTKEYWINGDRHRDDGPAIERADGTVEYWIEGEKIEPNDDQPTEIMPNGNRIWRNANGELHRENGPAVDCVGGERAWYRNGKVHREDGPAIERADGTVEYWLNGEPVDPPKASGRPKPR